MTLCAKQTMSSIGKFHDILFVHSLTCQDPREDDHPAEHARPAARLPPQGRCRLRGSAARHQPVQRDAQPRHRRVRQHQQRQPARLARQRPGRFHQARVHLCAAAAAVLELIGLRLALRTIRVRPAALARALQLWRPLLRPRLRCLGAGRRQMLAGARRAAPRPAGAEACCRSRNSTVSSITGTFPISARKPARSTASMPARLAPAYGSAGTTSSSPTWRVAKAIDGPIDDTRFRFAVSARN